MTNVDFCSGGGFLHFQNAFAFSIVSAELPEKDTLQSRPPSCFCFRFQGCTVTKFTLHRLPTLFMHSFPYIFDFLCPVFRVTSLTQHIGKRDFAIRNSILDVFLVLFKITPVCQSVIQFTTYQTHARFTDCMKNLF